MAWSLAVVAAAAALSGQQAAPQPPQTPTAVLEDVEVSGPIRGDMAREFVRRVAAPPARRGLARWRSICPGVANLEATAARSILDRIADVAHDIGVTVEEPGCEADIVIVFSADPGALARTMVENDPRVYDTGVGALQRGGGALSAFRTTDRPVRWWQLSVPIDGDTGKRAIRVPGDATGMVVDSTLARLIGCSREDCVLGAAPIIAMTSSSRLVTPVVEQLYKAIIIVDINQVAGLDANQIGDYLAMVSLAQIDPDADTGGFDTVLNLFENRAGPGLTGWDRTYLKALYDSPSRSRSPNAQFGAVAAIMDRAARDEIAND